MKRSNKAPARPFATKPTLSPAQRLAAEEAPYEGSLTSDDRRAAEVLIKHLFAPAHHRIDRLEYGAAYKLAGGAVGGDIVDVYHFDNGSVAFSIADISGKGAQAAIHAALVKYGIRCFCSTGLTPESALRALDRVYLENMSFERAESFASVFLGIFDDSRRSLTYASAGHEPVVLVQPGTAPYVLPPTAPLIGIFDDQHHLFKQGFVDTSPGTLLVATTDGVTEARSRDGGFFGMERLVQAIARNAERSPTELVAELLREVEDFAGNSLHDDVAAFAVRILPPPPGS
ncbi:MAG: PP2C family protein-serine/threonine phosphatase [Candidatus Baltobacteraceae bacterium]